MMRSIRHACALAAMLCATSAPALITVGPQGQFQGMQAGLNALTTSATETELRIQSGATFKEILTLTINSNRAFIISGGWDATFAQQTDNSSLTVLDGNYVGRVLSITLNAGTLHFDNVTVTHGFNANSAGGGLFVSTHGAGTAATLSRIAVHDNDSYSTGNVHPGGGGIFASAEQGPITIDNGVIYNNRALSFGAADVYGGGLFAQVYANAGLHLIGTAAKRTYLSANVADGGSGASSFGAGCFIQTLGNAVVELTFADIVDNIGRGNFAARYGCEIDMSNTAALTLANLRIVGNSEDAAHPLNSSQLYALAGTNSTFDVHDTVVSAGSGEGLHLGVGSGSSMRLLNLSIANNPFGGLLLDSTTGAQMYNSIVAGNGSYDISPALIPGDHDFIGGDPQFVSGDRYLHVVAGSPVRNAGNDAPPGGLAALDADGTPRLFESHVEIGAYEIGDPIFANGFE